MGGRPRSATSWRSRSTSRNARATRGQEVPAAWYEIPVFYFSNPGAVYGDGDEIAKPADTEKLDYELELACVIGEDGRPEGFTIMNDFSARDLQRHEMTVGLGSGQGQGLRHRAGAGAGLARRAPGRPRYASGRARQR